MPDKIIFNSDNPAFSYIGRVGSVNEGALFIYAGSAVKCRFTGTSAAVLLKNIPMGDYSAIGAVIDGVQYKIELINKEAEQFHIIAQNLPGGEHELCIFKRQAAAHYFIFSGLMTDENAVLLKVNDNFTYKIEVFGDSVSAGEVCESVYYEAHADPDCIYGFYDNSYFSYPMSLGRKLNACVHNNSQGGIALLNGTGYFGGGNKLIGLEQTYDKLSYVNYSKYGYTEWDFKKYIPDFVITAIGHNDDYPDPNAIHGFGYQRKWIEKYKEILIRLNTEYKTAKFILITTILMHEEIWDEMLDIIYNELKSELPVYRYRFKRNGKGTPGHPRITEHEEMALELTDFLSKL